MRAGHGTRAKRSGVTRGKDTAWFREQVERVVPEEPDAEMRVRYAEREIERLRKATIRALAQDQRLAGRQRATRHAFNAWEHRMAWHLREHHGIAVEERRDSGYVSYRLGDKYLGPWSMDDLHEQAHGRAS